MGEIIAPGRRFFAVAVVAPGAEHFVCARAKAAVRSVLPWLPPHPFWADLTGLMLLAAGLCIAGNLNARPAALLLGVFLLVCEVLLQIPRAAAPLDLSLRTTDFEVLSLSSAALTLAALLSPDSRSRQGSTVLDKFLLSGRYLFVVSSMGFGSSHFLVAPSIATLIPAWIPGRLFWAYSTGVAFVAAGVSMAGRCLGRLAATLLGTMFLLWFLLLHAPRVLSAERSTTRTDGPARLLHSAGVARRGLLPGLLNASPWCEFSKQFSNSPPALTKRLLASPLDSMNSISSIADCQ